MITILKLLFKLHRYCRLLGGGPISLEHLYKVYYKFFFTVWKLRSRREIHSISVWLDVSDLSGMENL